MTHPLTQRRVLVVGASFGEWYLNAFMQPAAHLVLAGLMTQGSQRSRQLAHDFGIPLYTDIDALPDDIDIACIAVSSTIAGGAGTRLAKAFLSRGIHVVQEHPVHPHDIRALQQLADQHHCCYWVNSLYAHAPAGRCWIADARRISERRGPARFITLTTSRQLLYSTLDMLLLAQAIPADALDVTLVDEAPCFHLLRYRWPSGTATLWLQRYQDPQRPDLHSLVMHHHLLGWPEGYLTLNASFGPVIWSSTLYVADPHDTSTSLYRRQEIMKESPALVRHPGPSQWRDGCEVEGPAAVAYLLTQLCQCLDGPALAERGTEAHHLRVAELWQRTLHAVGPAETQRLTEPRYDELPQWTYALHEDE